MSDSVRVDDRPFARALGAEIRRAREQHGLTREEFVRLLPSGIGDRTLLCYEHGQRYISCARLKELAAALKVPAWELFRAATKSEGDPTRYTLRIILRKLVNDDSPEFESVRQWAANRLKGAPATREVLLSTATIREMAAMLDLVHNDLAEYLAAFASERIADHR